MEEKIRKSEISALIHIPDSFFYDQAEESSEALPPTQSKIDLATECSETGILEVNNERVETALRQIQAKSDSMRTIANQKEVYILLAASTIIAVLYTISFHGQHIFPQISFTIFCTVAFFVLAKTLDILSYLRNRQSLNFAIPIISLALMNGIFNISGYNPFGYFIAYFNIIVIHILFAAFILTAISKKPIDLFSLSGLIKVGLTIPGNWITFFKIIRSLFTNRRKDQASSELYKMLIGALLALPLMIIIGSLLMSADYVFHSIIVSSIFALLRIDILFLFSICIVLTYCTGYIWHARSVVKRRIPSHSPVVADTYIIATFLAMINILFLFFSITQFAFLFAGGQLFELPGSIVYSSYARHGFFQLLVVTIINFAVIYILLTFFSKVDEKPIIQIMLYLLLAFTVVLIVSSFYRMFMYMSVYATTPRRLAVITFLVMELVLVAVTAAKLRNPKVPFVKYFALTLLAFYIIANVTTSGYVSARINVAIFLSGGTMRWIDITSSGADGLVVIRPFLESDDYVASNNLIIRRNEPNVPYFFRPDPFEWTYEEVASRLRHQSDNWQNWSLIEHLGRRTASYMQPTHATHVQPTHTIPAVTNDIHIYGDDADAPPMIIYDEINYSVGDTFTSDGIEYMILTVGENTGTVQVGRGRYDSPAVRFSRGDLTIPETVSWGGRTYTVTVIGDWAFFGISLPSVTIPNSVTTIGNGAFNRTSLTSVTIPNSVLTIGNRAFEYSNLTSVIISNSVTSIGDGVFFGTNLTSVTIPNRVTTIGDGAFSRTNLTRVTIPNSVTIIGNGAFENSNLTRVTIPNSVASIGHAAFANTNLTKVWFDGHAPSISPDTFSGLSSAAGAYVNRDATGFPAQGEVWHHLVIRYVNDGGIFRDSMVGDAFTSDGIEYMILAVGGDTWTVQVGKGRDDPLAVPQHTQGELTIPTTVSKGGRTYTVTTIGFGAFIGTNLTSVIIPNSVTTIGDRAFYASNHLTSVTIPNSVTSIGDWAFSETNLPSVTIPNSVLTIGRGAFGYSNLTSVIIPNSVTFIGSEAFANTNLTSVTIPNSVTFIGNEAFVNTNLTNVIIPNSVTSIGNEAFANTDLTGVTIPNSVISIGRAAFANTNLTEVWFDGDAPIFNYSVFQGSPNEIVAYVRRNAIGFPPEGEVWRSLTIRYIQ